MSTRHDQLLKHCLCIHAHTNWMAHVAFLIIYLSIYLWNLCFFLSIYLSILCCYLTINHLRRNQEIFLSLSFSLSYSLSLSIYIYIYIYMCVFSVLVYFSICPFLIPIYLSIYLSIIIIIIIIIYRVIFPLSVSRCILTGVLVTTSLLKSPGLSSVSWPISIMQ